MGYTMGERLELIITCHGYEKAYEGLRSQSYYAIKVNFKDDKEKQLIWYTRENTHQTPPKSGTYKVKATIKGFDKQQIIISRVNILEKII